MTLLEGEDLHIKIHQWWHDIRFHEKNSHRFYLQHVRSIKLSNQPMGRTYVVQQHNLIIIWHSIPEAAMNQHIENPGCFKPWPALIPDGQLEVTNKQPTFPKGSPFNHPEEGHVRRIARWGFFHHLFFWNELFIFFAVCPNTILIFRPESVRQTSFLRSPFAKKLLFWGLRGIEINAAM